MALPHTLPRQLEKESYHWMPWGWKAPYGHTVDMLMDPEYWVHALQMSAVKQYDTVRVIAEDGSFGVDLMFVEIDDHRLWATVRVLQELPVGRDKDAAASPVPAKDADGWEVSWGGPVHKWRIISPAGALADKGFSRREDAEAALLKMKPQRAA